MTSEPAGAEVLLNDVSVGVTPIHAGGLVRGSYLVRVQLASHIPYQRVVTLEEGATVRLAARLLRAEQLPEKAAAGKASRSTFARDTQRPRFAIGAGLGSRDSALSFKDAWSAADTHTQDYGSWSYTWTWDTSLDARYAGGTSPMGLALTGDLWLPHGFGVGLSLERFSREVDADVSSAFKIKETEQWRGSWSNYTWTDEVSISSSGSIEGLGYRTTMLHLMLKWRRPVADRVSLELFAGPSRFNISQRVIGELYEFDGCRESGDSSYSENQRNTGCRVEHKNVERQTSAVGFNLGAAIAVAVQEKLDLVLQLRYSVSPSQEVGGLDPTNLVDDLEDSLPYDYSGSASPARIKLESGGLVPAVTLRYTF